MHGPSHEPEPAAAVPHGPVLTALGRILRDASLTQTSQYFQDGQMSLAEPEASVQAGQVVRRYMTLVTMSSPVLRMVVKVHFDPDHIRAYRQSRGVPARELSHARVVDYMKELVNQTGGRVCRAFESHGISMGMSVPLCTRGIYEIYADYALKDGSVLRGGDLWRVNGAPGTLYHSSYCEVLETIDFSRISCAQVDSSEGEVDFL